MLSALWCLFFAILQLSNANKTEKDLFASLTQSYVSKKILIPDLYNSLQNVHQV